MRTRLTSSLLCGFGLRLCASRRTTRCPRSPGTRSTVPALRQSCASTPKSRASSSPALTFTFLATSSSRSPRWRMPTLTTITLTKDSMTRRQRSSRTGFSSGATRPLRRTRCGCATGSTPRRATSRFSRKSTRSLAISTSSMPGWRCSLSSYSTKRVWSTSLRRRDSPPRRICSWRTLTS